MLSLRKAASKYTYMKIKIYINFLPDENGHSSPFNGHWLTIFDTTSIKVNGGRVKKRLFSERGEGEMLKFWNFENNFVRSFKQSWKNVWKSEKKCWIVEYGGTHHLEIFWGALVELLHPLVWKLWQRLWGGRS